MKTVPAQPGATLFEQDLPPDRRVFEEPWQAEAFAIAVQLHDRGLFSWPEWSEALGAEIAKSGERGEENYFLCWLNAVESLVERKAVASRAELAGPRRCVARGLPDQAAVRAGQTDSSSTTAANRLKPTQVLLRNALKQAAGWRSRMIVNW